MKIFLILLFFPLCISNAQNFYEYVFSPDNNYPDQKFGYFPIITDSMIIISAHHDNINGDDTGSLYYYRKRGNIWKFINKITPNAPRYMEGFGIPFLSGNKLYVGAIPLTDIEYVYEFYYENNDWVQKHILSVNEDSIRFGYGRGFGSLIVKFNNELFVGAVYDSRFTLSHGSVYYFIFQDTSWMEKQVILPKYRKRNANFGTSIYFNNQINQLIISAPYESNSIGRRTGNVYVFEKDNNKNFWIEKQLISPEEGDISQFFGFALAGKGDYLFIGAPGHHIANSPGVVYIYRNENGLWKYKNKIISPLNQPKDKFGHSLAFDGEKLLVGAPGSNFCGPLRRAFAYLYDITGNNAKLLHTFAPTNSPLRDAFGISVSFF